MGVSTIINVVLTVASAAYQHAQERKRRQAAERAREASLGQEVRPSGSANPVAVLYGYTQTDGTRVFVATNSSAGSALSGGLGGLTGGTGSKNEFLMSQTVLGAGQIDAIVSTDVNGTYLVANPDDEDAQAIYDGSFVTLSAYGQAEPAATAFSPSNRGANTTFTGLSKATNIFKLNRGEPQFNGVPSVTHYVRGNRIYDITKDPLYNTGVPVAEQQSFTDQSSWTFSITLL